MVPWSRFLCTKYVLSISNEACTFEQRVGRSIASNAIEMFRKIAPGLASSGSGCLTWTKKALGLCYLGFSGG